MGQIFWQLAVDVLEQRHKGDRLLRAGGAAVPLRGQAVQQRFPSLLVAGYNRFHILPQKLPALLLTLDCDAGTSVFAGVLHGLKSKGASLLNGLIIRPLIVRSGLCCEIALLDQPFIGRLVQKYWFFRKTSGAAQTRHNELDTLRRVLFGCSGV